MSDPTAQEPTMEEILASIRRIISEDDAPAADSAHAADAPPAGGGAAHEAAGEHAAEPDREPEPHHDEPEEVLELTQRVEPPPAPKAAPEPAPFTPPPAADHSVGDLDVFSAAAIEPPAPPPPPRKPEPAPEPAPWHAAGAEVDEEEPLIADHRADAAADHFGSLAKSVSMPAAGRSLEDVVRELLRPMLKEWLDQNLPQIVETRVQAEVERISRRRVY